MQLTNTLSAYQENLRMKEENKQQFVKGEGRVKGEGSLKGDGSMKGETYIKGESGRTVKSEARWAVKNEKMAMRGGDDEAGNDFDCYINKIDHSKKSIDFSALPDEVVKADLLNQGIRVCTLNKKQMAACIEDTWIYRKTGKCPDRFVDSEDEDEERYLQKFHEINANKKEFWAERRREQAKWSRENEALYAF